MHRMKIINRWGKCDLTPSPSMNHNSVQSGVLHSGFIPGSAPASSIRGGVPGHHMCGLVKGNTAINEMAGENSQPLFHCKNSLQNSDFQIYAKSRSLLPYAPLFQKPHIFTKS